MNRVARVSRSVAELGLWELGYGIVILAKCLKAESLTRKLRAPCRAWFCQLSMVLGQTDQQFHDFACFRFASGQPHGSTADRCVSESVALTTLSTTTRSA